MKPLINQQTKLLAFSADTDALLAPIIPSAMNVMTGSHLNPIVMNVKMATT